MGDNMEEYILLEREIKGLDRIYFDKRYRVLFNNEQLLLSVKLVKFECSESIRKFHFEILYNYTRLYKRGHIITCEEKDIISIRELGAETCII